MENNFDIKQKLRNGRKKMKMVDCLHKQLFRNENERICVSQRNLAKKFNILQSYVDKILKKSGLRYYKRSNVAKLTMPDCLIPNNKKFLIIDDES